MEIPLVKESEVTLTECRDYFSHNHYFVWKFKKYCLTSPSVKTTVFSPIPNLDVAFYFELWYKELVIDRSTTVCTFKICLVRSCGVNIPPYLKMKINVSINYDSDEKIFREYKQDDISVETMSIVTIANEFFKKIIYNGFNEAIYTYSPNAFIYDFSFTCDLVFYDHLSTPAAYYKDIRSFKNLKQFANDFSCLYQQNPSSIPEAANKLNDVEIKIGNETFLAHKLVLASHSQVFLKMFDHDFLESKTSVINISDFSAETFRSFLQYLYSGKIENLSWPTVKELYALADKYDVRTLKRECAEISSTFLSVDAVCEILRMAYDYGDEHLKFEGKKFAFIHIKELLPTSGWKELIRHNPLIGYEVMMKYAPKLD